MTDWTLARIREYYRVHSVIVATQLRGRPVTCYPPGPGPTRIDSPAELLAVTESGVGGFRITPSRHGSGDVDRMLIDLTPGDGADVATAATVALELGDRLQLAGRRAVAMVDGQGGMQLLIPCAPMLGHVARAELAVTLAVYAAECPELATLDPALAAGRVLLATTGTDTATTSWAPYSLVPGGWPGVVTPIDRDDVAAASAGMPLEIEPEDVADRLRLRGDLLAAAGG